MFPALCNSHLMHTLIQSCQLPLIKCIRRPLDREDCVEDVSTTMNIYAHATREAKRTSARLLDKVVGTA